MSSADRFERLIRWYPPTWRARYGVEFVALLEDTHGMGDVPWRERLAIAKSGSVERARSAGLLGDSASPNERIRAGSLLILCRVGLLHAGGWDLRRNSPSTGPP